MRRRKNILFLANRVPFPPNKGDKIRTFHQLDHLALSHRVYCACFVDRPGDAAYVQDLKRWCVDVIALPWTRKKAVVHAAAGWLGGAPLSVAAYRDRRMMRRLAGWAETIDFDVVVAFSSSMAPYALAVPAKRRVLDMCDVDSAKWLDYAGGSMFPASTVYGLEGRRLRRFESNCLEKFDATMLITERERQILDPDRRCPRLYVVPNGTTMCPGKPPPPSECGSVIGFVGEMSYRPNVEGICWFAHDVWPHILGAIPEARLRIVGRHPTRSVRRLERVTGIEVSGAVDDIRQELIKFRVAVAPLQIARGMQNKVLEAMAMRRPVVATSAVVGGLKMTPGRSILAADEAGAFAEKVIELCQFDSICDQIGDAGYRCVATSFNWPDALQRYEQVVLGSTEPQLPVLPLPRPHRLGDRLSALGGVESWSAPMPGRKAGLVNGETGAPPARSHRPRSPYAALLRGEDASNQEQHRGNRE